MTDINNNDVWVFVEQRDGKPADVSFELLCKGRKLARRLRGHVPGILMGIGNLALVEVAPDYAPAARGSPRTRRLALHRAILDGLRRETHARCVAARVIAVMASERFAEAAERRPEDDRADHAGAGPGRARRAAPGAGGGAGARPARHAARSDRGARAPEDPEEELSAAQLGHAAVGAIQLLPEQQRALVERHYFGGDAFDVIAGNLGISKSWACRLHAQAIHTLSGNASQYLPLGGHSFAGSVSSVKSAGLVTWSFCWRISAVVRSRVRRMMSS